MASFCYRIRSTQKNNLVKIQILFTVGRGNQFYVDSQYMVLTDAWDNKRQTVKSRFTFTDDFTEQQGRELTKNLSELRSHILGEIAKDPEHAMTKTRLEKIIYSFHHPRSLTTGRRVRSRESLGDYIARFTREMEEGTRLNIHKLRYGPSTIKNYKGFVVQFDEYCKARRKQFDFADIDNLGNYREDNTYDDKHIEAVLSLKLVDVEAIRNAKFKVAIDCVNSVGGVILPKLLERLGVEKVEKLYCDPTGDFQHNPEPLEKNLGDIMGLMAKGGYDVAFVVDPDVDRLAMICEDGKMYGEEYTLVTIADYVLKHTPGNTVSNLSSTRALRDVTRKYGCEYNASAVGEVNVVAKIRATNAVIGGEGNGGVIYPESHCGRDALVGIALFLSHLAHEGKTVSELRATYPPYFIAKNRIDLTPETDVDAILAKVKEMYKDEEVNDVDGVKIDFPDKWVHLRKSNTEPIIRVYSEASTMEAADEIGQKIMNVVYSLVK